MVDLRLGGELFKIEIVVILERLEYSVYILIYMMKV